MRQGIYGADGKRYQSQWLSFPPHKGGGNLAPATSKKAAQHSISLSLSARLRQVNNFENTEKLTDYVIMGELSLDGTVDQ